MRLLSLLVLAASLAACDSTNPINVPGETTVEGVTFRVNRTQVRQGEAVELALVNGTDRIIRTGVFGCDRIERREGDEWVVREEDNDRACILPLFTILPEQTYDGGFTLDVAPGTVRLVHGFNFQGTGRTESILSPPIRVVR